MHKNAANQEIASPHLQAAGELKLEDLGGVHKYVS
jgi:hypothetical protein